MHPFFEGFKRGFVDSARHAPRRFFAPLVGAVAGAIEYTNSAWDKVPVGQRRAAVYARLLSALANQQTVDQEYSRRLVEAVLNRHGDRLQDSVLVGFLPDDLKAFDCSEWKG